ncbi:uncharacterized protein LOC131939257 isoform X1 [Physella acuta]|uniref:uncharacterized protein LOC131939257 isoform X1 n=1 Tax=Physella acuta TaxID=109671 RepID=UPI0027DAE482|nr:uncharacterized protein LOC131939257 isoform X1 [Physella acuta]
MRSETDQSRLDLDQSPRSGMDESKLEFAEDISKCEKRHSSHRGCDRTDVTSGHSSFESSGNCNGYSSLLELHQVQGIFERNVQSTMPALSSATPCNNADDTPFNNSDGNLKEHGKSIYLDNHKDNNLIEKNNNKSEPRNRCFISEPSDSHLNCTRTNNKPATPVQISTCTHSKTSDGFQKENGYLDFSSTENVNKSKYFNEHGSNSTCIESKENRDKFSKSLSTDSHPVPGISIPSLGSSPSTSPPPNHNSSSDYTTASITNSASSLSDGRQERASSEGLSEAEFPHFDSVVMETDVSVRRISFTLSLGSDGSSSGQDSQDRPTQPVKSLTNKPGNRADDKDDAIVEAPDDVTKHGPSRLTTTDNDLHDTTTTRKSRTAGGGSQGDARATLTMRISKSLSNFFQKHPQRQSPMSDTGELIQARDECPKASGKGSFKSKAPKRSNSLAGRVMSSLARLGRKGDGQDFHGRDGRRGSDLQQQQEHARLRNARGPGGCYR